MQYIEREIIQNERKKKELIGAKTRRMAKREKRNYEEQNGAHLSLY